MRKPGAASGRRPYQPDHAPDRFGLSRNWVGLILLTTVTSLPELVTGLSAVTVAAPDIAVGDVLMLTLDDVAYVIGPMYAQVLLVHTATAITACLMSGNVIVSLASRPTKRVAHVASWSSLTLLALYLLNAAIQYWHG